MIEFCRTVAINVFWVLAAATEILIVTGVILAIADRLIEKHPEDQE